MIPFTAEEFLRQLLLYGCVIVLSRWKDGVMEDFILEPHKVELRDVTTD